MQRPDLDAPSSEWLVYGDSLQVAGDPRGELISLVHGADAKARDAYVHKHAESLLGAAAKPYRQNAFRLQWKHCFIDTAEVLVDANNSGEHAVRSLREAPAAELMRELAIVGVTTEEKRIDASKALAAAVEAPWPTCRSLALVDERATRSRTQVAREFGTDENLVDFGSLDAIWSFANLEHLRLELADLQNVALERFDGTNLRTFTLRGLRYSDGWGEQAPPLAQHLASTTWPKLEELELRLAETFCANIPLERKPYVAVYSVEDEEEDGGRYDEADDGDNDGVNYAELEPLLAKLRASPLRRLALTSFDSASSLLDVLARSGLPPTLRVLDLSDSSLDRGHVTWMRENAKLFAPLTQLVLERTGIEETALAELQGLGPAIVHSYADDAPTYRYVVGME